MPVQLVAYCTHRDYFAAEFPHELEAVRDESERGFVEHLMARVQRLMELSDGEAAQTVYAVCRHLQRSKHLVQMSVDGEHVEALAPWAWKNNAVLLLPDGSFRDPNGAVLVDPDTGMPDERAQLPFLPDARQRKVQTELDLRNRSIDIPEFLPPVVSVDEVELRTAEEVAWRCQALFMVAVRAESLANDQPIALTALKKRLPLAMHSLTTWEKEFVENEHPAPEAVSAAGWRYEALAALLWSLGLTPELPFPDQICNVPDIAERMMAINGAEMVNDAQLRPVEQILDALDCHYRLLWVCRGSALAETDPPAGLEEGVVVERQHALNWLTSFERADWDDVDTPS